MVVVGEVVLEAADSALCVVPARVVIGAAVVVLEVVSSRASSSPEQETTSVNIAPTTTACLKLTISLYIGIRDVRVSCSLTTLRS